MIYLTYILPLIIIIIWPKRPFWSLVLALIVLFVGLLGLYYFEAQETFVTFDILTPENMPGMYAYAVGRSIRPLLIGFVIFRIVHYIRRHFYKKAILQQRANEAFE